MANHPAFTPSELAELPPSILNTLPALQPPAGVEPNFVNPEDRAYLLTTVATVLFCLMVFLYINRVYTKLCIVHKTSWDDCKCTFKYTNQDEADICAK